MGASTPTNSVFFNNTENPQGLQSLLVNGEDRSLLYSSNNGEYQYIFTENDPTLKLVFTQAVTVTTVTVGGENYSSYTYDSTELSVTVSGLGNKQNNVYIEVSMDGTALKYRVGTGYYSSEMQVDVDGKALLRSDSFLKYNGGIYYMCDNSAEDKNILQVSFKTAINSNYTVSVSGGATATIIGTAEGLSKYDIGKIQDARLDGGLVYTITSYYMDMQISQSSYAFYLLSPLGESGLYYSSPYYFKWQPTELAIDSTKYKDCYQSVSCSANGQETIIFVYAFDMESVSFSYSQSSEPYGDYLKLYDQWWENDWGHEIAPGGSPFGYSGDFGSPTDPSQLVWKEHTIEFESTSFHILEFIYKNHGNGVVAGLDNAFLANVNGKRAVPAQFPLTIDSSESTISYNETADEYRCFIEKNDPQLALTFESAITVSSLKVNGVDHSSYSYDEATNVLTINNLPNESNDIVAKVSIGAMPLTFRMITGFKEMPTIVSKVDGVNATQADSYLISNQGVDYLSANSETDKNILSIGFETALGEKSKVEVIYNGTTTTITDSEIKEIGKLSGRSSYAVKYYFADILVSETNYSNITILEPFGTTGLYYINDTTYPWIKTEAQDSVYGFEYYQSSNQGKDSTESIIWLYSIGYDAVSFSYTQSGECLQSNGLYYDLLKLYHQYQENDWSHEITKPGPVPFGSDTTFSDNTENLIWKDHTVYFSSSTFNILEFIFKKDGSGVGGLDSAFISNVKALNDFNETTEPYKARVTIDGTTTERELTDGDTISFVHGKNNSVTLLMPLINQGETCSVYINGTKEPIDVRIDGRYYYFIINNIQLYQQIKFVYEKVGFVSREFNVILDISLDKTLEEALVTSGNVDVSTNDYAYPFAFNAQLSGAEKFAIASTNQEQPNSISGISLTVYESGILYFDYYISCEQNGDCFYYHTIAITGKTQEGIQYIAGTKENSSGGKGWRTFSMPITVSEGGSYTIHLAYIKDDTADSLDDACAVANVVFAIGNNTVTYSVTNDQAGSVTLSSTDNDNITSGADISAGSTVTLKAVINQGYKFYAWKNVTTNTLIFQDTIIWQIIDDVEYIAVIGTADEYALRSDSNYYTSIENALQEVTSGNLYLLKDVTLQNDITIPQNVHLIVPYSVTDYTGYGEGGSHFRVSWNDGVDPYITLTINNGATLTVNGNLMIGAVQHGGDQHATGRTSGDYSKLVNNGSVVVNGKMDVRGLVVGTGTLTVNSGAELKQPFMVNNYNGGTNTYALYDAGQFPFVNFSTVNVQCKQIINYGAKVIGSTSLYFWSAITTQDVVLIDKLDAVTNLPSHEEGSLIWMYSGSSLEITYDDNKTVDQIVGGSYGHGGTGIHLGDSGVTTITIFGKILAGEFYLQGFGSKQMFLAIPYTYNFIIKDGATVEIKQSYKIMPGAVVTVENGGTIDILQSGALLVYDGLIQGTKSGKVYPSADILAMHGFNKSAMLIVNGTLNIGGTFAGIVQSTVNGTIVVGENANVGEQTVTEGCTGGYENNLTTFKLSARVWGVNGFANLKPNKTYACFGASEFVLPQFTVDSASGCTSLTVTLNQAMAGRFLEKVGDKFVAEIKFYIGTSVSGIKVKIDGLNYLTDENGYITATVSFGMDGVVKYSTPDKFISEQNHTVAFGEIEILAYVVEKIELANNNCYTRIYDKDGTIAQDYVLNATITFYGGATQDIALSFDESVLTATVNNNVVLSNASVVNNLNGTLNVVSQAVSQYVYDVQNLASVENIVQKAQDIYQSYSQFATSGTADDIAFVTDYLSEYIGYACQIVSSISASDGIVYGDITAQATATYVDGTTASVTIDLSNWHYENNSIKVNGIYRGSYLERSYQVSVDASAVKKAVSLTISGDKIVVYNGEEHEFSVVVNGIVTGDNITYKRNEKPTVDVGNYNISYSLQGDKVDFYFLTGEISVSLEIKARNVTVSIAQKSSVYGEQMASLEYTASNVIDGDDLGITLIKKRGVAVDSYDITGTWTNTNYNVTFVCGENAYTVTKKPITVSIDGKSSIYGDAFLELTYTEPNGIVGSDDLGITLTKEAGVNVGSYDIIGAYTNGNYAVTFVGGEKAYIVTQKAINVTINRKTSVYGEDIAELTYTEPNGIVGSDNLVITLSKQEGVNVGSYDITGTWTNNNYAVTFVGGDKAYTITVKAIEVRVNKKSSVYGEAFAELTYTEPNGIVGSDNLGITLTKKVGVNVGLYDITGTWTNNNYAVTFVGGDKAYTITQKDIEISINEKSSVYGEAFAELTYTEPNGIVDSDELGISLIKEGGIIVGSYDITGAWTNTNYNVTFVGGENAYTITKKPITVLIDGKSSIYGDAFVELTYIEPDGILGSDDLGITLTKEVGVNVGSYDIIGAYTNGNYAITFVGGEKAYTVTQKTINVTINRKTSVYGETFAELACTIPSSGIVGSDDIGIILTKQAGVNVGSYDITGTWTNTNYNVTFVGGDKAYTITVKAIEVIVNKKSSVYGDAFLELTYTEPNGIVGSDDLGITLTKQSGVNVGSYDIIGTWSNNNYTVNFVGGEKAYTITAKDIEISINSKSTVYGEAFAELTYAEPNGIVGSDNLGIILTKQEGVIVGSYDIIGAYSNSNYAVTFVGGENAYTITPIQVMVTVNAIEHTIKENSNVLVVTSSVDKTAYNEEYLSTLTYEILSGENVIAKVDNGVITMIDDNKLLEGSYVVRAVNSDSNYQIVENKTTTLNVVKASDYYSVDFKLSNNVIYDGNSVIISPVVKITSTGEVLTVDNYTINISLINGEHVSEIKNVNSYIITVTIEKEEFSHALIVSKRTLTVSIDNKSSVYGDAFLELTYTKPDGIVGSDDLGVTLTKEVGINVGSYDITGTWTNTNYNVTFVGGENAYTVTKKPITVSIDGKSSIYGDAFLELTYTEPNGLVGSDDLGITLTKEAGVNVGSYDIIGAYTNGNYAVTFVGGEKAYIVTQKEIIATINSKTSVYGDDIVELTYTKPDGIVGSDDLDIILTKEVGVNVGSYDIIGACTNNNYAVTFVGGENAYTITPKDINVTINRKTSVYGEAFAELACTIPSSGIVGADDIGIILTKQAGVNVGSYDITGTWTNTNYNVTFVGGDKAYTITVKAIEVIINKKSSVYGDAFLELTYTEPNGIVGSDDLGITLTKETGVNVGSYDIIGAWTNTNYAVTFVCSENAYTVTKKPITILIDSKSSVYGEEFVKLTYTESDGVVGSDDLGIILTKEVGLTVGSYDITGAYTNNNYAVTFVGGEKAYTIIAKNIEISINSRSTVYGEAFAELTYVEPDGIVGSDDLGITLSKQEGVNVGSYDITGAWTNNNYAVTFVGGEKAYTVTQKTINVTINRKTSVYGEEIVKLTYTEPNGIVGSDDLGITLTKEVGVNVGSYDIIGTYTNNNYAITFVGGDKAYTITVKAIDVIINNKSSIYGEVFAELTYTEPNEIVGSDELGITLTKQSGVNVGSYDITGTYTNNNYSITFIGGEKAYTIIAKNIEISINEKSSIYGDSFLDLTYTKPDGIVGSDDLGITLSKQSGVNAGSYDITGSWTNTNYNVTFVGGEDAYIITKKSVSLVIDNKTSTYGEAIAKLTASVSDNLAYSDDYNSLGITLIKEAGVNVGEYSITGTWLNDNYNISYEAGVYIITPREITVAVDNKSSVYGEEFAPLTCTASFGTFANGEDISVLNIQLSVGDISLVGIYPINAVYNNGNYTVNFTTAQYEITKRKVTIKITDRTSVYGDALSNLTYSVVYGEIIGSDDLGVELSKESGLSVGDYDIIANIDNANTNYEITVEYTSANSSTYLITKRPVTVQINSIENVTVKTTWEELSNKFGYTVKEGNFIVGDIVSFDYYVIINEEEISSENYHDKICGGQHTISAQFLDTNYNVTVLDGSLKVVLPIISLVEDSLTDLGFVYDGQEHDIFDYRSMLTGYLSNVTDGAFKAVYYLENDTENPVKLMNAGCYKMQIEIVHNNRYTFADGKTLSAFIDVVVSKKDISESITISVDGLREKGYVVSAFGLAIGESIDSYEVSLNKELTLNGESIDAYNGSVGSYVYRIVVSDDNLKGSKEISFRVIESASKKIADLAKYASVKKYGDGEYTLVSKFVLTLTADDFLQIEDEGASDSYSSVLALLDGYKKDVADLYNSIKFFADEYILSADKGDLRLTFKNTYDKAKVLTDIQKSVLSEEQNAYILSLNEVWASADKELQSQYSTLNALLESYLNGDASKIIEAHEYVLTLGEGDLELLKASEPGENYQNLWEQFHADASVSIAIANSVSSNALFTIVSLIQSAFCLAFGFITKIFG